jgi:hypothetical protein
MNRARPILSKDKSASRQPIAKSRAQAIEAAHKAHAAAENLTDKKQTWNNLQSAIFPDARIGKPAVRVSRAGQLAVRKGAR